MGLLALLLHLGGAATPLYRDRLKVIALVSAIAVSMVNAGDAIWWAMPWGWEAAQIFYNFTALMLGGSVLAFFVRPET